MLIHRQVSWDTRWGRQACGHSRINIHTPWAVLSFAVKFLTGVIGTPKPRPLHTGNAAWHNYHCPVLSFNCHSMSRSLSQDVVLPGSLPMPSPILSCAVLSQPFLTRGTFAGLTTAFLSYPVLFVTRGILLTQGTALRASLPLSCFFFCPSPSCPNSFLCQK